jgi:hypothetical protein
MTNSNYRILPKYDKDNIDDFIRDSGNVIAGIMLGKTNNTGTCTLNAGATSTTITLPSGLLGPYTQVIFTPTTASAATEFGAGKLYVSTITPSTSQFVITHTNTADVDKIFRYVLVG